jgi:hypothetical protein
MNQLVIFTYKQGYKKFATILNQSWVGYGTTALASIKDAIAVMERETEENVDEALKDIHDHVEKG